MPLTGKQTRHLRGLGHHLDPVVQIGKNGITEALVAQLAEAILRHELVKVRLLPECPVDRHEVGGELATAIGGELVQTLGRTLLFWKRNPAAVKVELPKANAKKPKAKAKAGEAEPEEAGKSTSKGKLPPSRAAHAERIATKEAEEKARAEARAKPFRSSPRGAGTGSRAGGGYRAGSGSRAGTGGSRTGAGTGGSRTGAGSRAGTDARSRTSRRPAR